MWYLIAAVCLWVYLGCKSGTEQHRVKKIRNDYTISKAREEAFFQQYCISLEEENNIKDMMLNVTPEMAKFSDELEKIIGIKPTHPMLIWGYIAKQGKLPSWLTVRCSDSDNPLASKHDSIWSSIDPWSNLKISEMREAKFKFLKWYNEELKSNGMEYDLKCIPWSGMDEDRTPCGGCMFHPKGNAKSIMECQAVYPAAFLWSPMSSAVCDTGNLSSEN